MVINNREALRSLAGYVLARLQCSLSFMSLRPICGSRFSQSHQFHACSNANNSLHHQKYRRFTNDSRRTLLVPWPRLDLFQPRCTAFRSYRFLSQLNFSASSPMAMMVHAHGPRRASSPDTHYESRKILIDAATTAAAALLILLARPSHPVWSLLTLACPTDATHAFYKSPHIHVVCRKPVQASTGTTGSTPLSSDRWLVLSV